MDMLKLTVKLNEVKERTAGPSAERRAKIDQVLTVLRGMRELHDRLKALSIRVDGNSTDDSPETMAQKAVDGRVEGPEFLMQARGEVHRLVDEWFMANVGGIFDPKAGPRGKFVEVVTTDR